MKEYRLDLDALKGVCIIAVVLFHCGLLRSGYLGVDVFFVINGFLIIPSLFKHVESNNFSYVDFLKKRTIRLFPLVILLCFVSLILGGIFMLPFEYERLTRSVVSSLFLSENLRSAFTFGNYWEILNDYSPLFHLWYIGVLFEFYIVFPLLVLLLKKIANVFKKENETIFIRLSMAIFALSLIAYLFIPIDSSYKFYLLPFRLFELLAGGLVAIYARKLSMVIKHPIQGFCLILLLTTIFLSIYSIICGDFGRQIKPIAPYEIGITTEGLPVPPTVLLISTVLFSCLTIFKEEKNVITTNKFFVYLGKRSYSIFIWHQFVIAFYRNIIGDEVSVISVLICLGLTLAISELSYTFVEKRTKINKILVVCVFSILVLCPTALYIYKSGGVIKDIPELDLKRGDGFVGIAVAYVDIPSKDDVPFPKKSNGKKNVLVVGNSFSRDFSNILRESEYGDKLNFSQNSYGYPADRISEADYIFTFLQKESLTDSILVRLKPSCKIYGIGTKNFGKSNNQFYSHRWSDNYYNSMSVLPAEYKRANEIAKEHWGEGYIDLIAPAMVDGTHVRVFTPDRKYISQDCKHLTKAGARWYASVLNLKAVFGEL